MFESLACGGLPMAAAAVFSSLCVVACAAEGGVPIACNPHAIGAAKRARYRELVQRLSSAVKAREEVSGGYRYTLDSGGVTLQEVGEWMAMERLCCPFLDFQLAVGARGDVQLTLRGSAGTQAILEAAFPVGR